MATGGGILASASSGTINWTLPNDIIDGNSSPAAGEQIDISGAGTTTVTVRASVVQQGVGDLDPADIGMGADKINLIGTIPDDPDFVDPDSNDYHLDSSSPAIDAGANAADPGEATIPTDDFENDPRPNNAGDPNDIGADEFTTVTVAQPQESRLTFLVLVQQLSQFVPR